MKRLLLTCLTVILLVGFGTTNLFADGWALGDWSANVNGPTYNPPDLSSPVTSSPAGFPTTGGSALGTFTFTINSGGPNFVGVYLYPYYNSPFGDLSSASASAVGTAPSGLTYQMGWPGVDPVFDNFASNSLDGSNTVGTSAAPPTSSST